MKAGQDVPLVGRERELGLIRDALAAARDGRGGTLTFIGEPGSGKTALLSAARDMADGFVVLSCRGVEWEAELPFSGLQELLGPARAAMDALPDAQRDALSGALGLERSAHSFPLAVYAAALALLRAARGSGPLVLLVDDLHWLDEPTARTLAFASRRLVDEGVLFLVAGRTGALLPGVDVAPRLLGPIDQDDVRALAAAHLGYVPPEHDVAHLTAASGGNPLAVVETVRAATPLLGLRRTALDGPLPVGELIERRFADRLSTLSEPMRRTLGLVSASLVDDTAVLFSALDRIGIGRDALLEVERAGLIRIDGTKATFNHPLLRSLVHRRADPDERRSYHRALAEVDLLSEDLRAWHAACAATQTDEPTAERLDACAERFLARSGRLAAAQALARAADLTPAPGARADRLLRAAQCAHFAGRANWAEELLTAAAGDATAGSATALWVEFEQLCIGMHLHGGEQAGERYLELARRADGTDDELAVHALLQSLTEDLLTGWTGRARAAGTMLRELIASRPLDPSLASTTRAAWALFVAFDGTAEERAEAESDMHALAGELLDDRPALAGAPVIPLTYALLHLDEIDTAERLLREADEVVATSGDEFLRGSFQLLDALVLIRTGDWDGARGALDGARVALRTGGHAGQLVPVDATELWIRAARGEEGVAEGFRHLHDPALRHGYGVIAEWEGTARGLLALGAGDIEGAVRWLEGASGWEPEPPRHPVAHSAGWPVDLVEGYVLAGREDDAAALAERLEALALASQRPWAQGAASLARGLLADDADDVAEHCLRAIERFAEARDRFYEARARLAYGRKLRRARRLGRARPELNAARAAFVALGATPWVAQVDVELGAGGAVDGGPDALTAQERQVAELVAAGASNKEAGAQLFLSPKTIEAHLSRAYRKLGVTSRTQLAARWNELGG